MFNNPGWFWFQCKDVKLLTWLDCRRRAGKRLLRAPKQPQKHRECFRRPSDVFSWNHEYVYVKLCKYDMNHTWIWIITPSLVDYIRSFDDYLMEGYVKSIRKSPCLLRSCVLFRNWLLLDWIQGQGQQAIRQFLIDAGFGVVLQASGRKLWWVLVWFNSKNPRDNE